MENEETSKCETAEKGQHQGLVTNRIKLIHTITNLVEGSGIIAIEDRDYAAMLAIHIVDGLEDEAERQKMRAVAMVDEGQHEIFNFDTGDSEFDFIIDKKGAVSFLSFIRRRQDQPDDTVKIWVKTEWLDKIRKILTG